MSDALLTRIRALQSKTTDRGCTEQEAMAAALKVAELLDRHGLTVTELEREAAPCIQTELRTSRSRPGPYDECAGAVAAFFDCRTWMQRDLDGRISHVFFGLPADVEAATYLMHLIAHAFETEANRFRAGPGYLRGRGNGRRLLHTSFMAGLSHGIQDKLAAMLRARNATREAGQALVVAKAGVVEAELAKLGFRFARRSAAARRVNPEAFGTGRDAGERFEVRRGLKG